MKSQIDFQQQIKERMGWPDAIVRFLHSREEAEVYIKAGVVERRIGGRAALVKTDIDWRAFNCRQEWLKESMPIWTRGRTITTPFSILTGIRSLTDSCLTNKKE